MPAFAMPSVRCPTCQKRFDSGQSESMPFCSDRCRLLDLGRWLEEGYGLPYEGEEQRPRQEPDE